MHVHMMIATMGLFVFFCQVFACVTFCFYHNNICQALREGKILKKYKFKNIFWSFVFLLLLGEPFTVGLGLEHIISYGFQATDWRKTIYVVAFIFMFAMFCCDFGIALLFAIKSSRDEIIELPNIMQCFSPGRKYDTVCTQISQFLAILTLLFSSMILSIFICGVILAVLIHPLRVGLMAVVTVSFMIAFILVLANTFELCDKSCNCIKRTKSNNERTKCNCRPTLLTFFWLFILIIQSVLIILFSFVYLKIVLFNDPDKTGVLNQLAQLFPFVLIILFVKKEEDILQNIIWIL